MLSNHLHLPAVFTAGGSSHSDITPLNETHWTSYNSPDRLAPEEDEGGTFTIGAIH
jgi:hypothetical protein